MDADGVIMLLAVLEVFALSLLQLPWLMFIGGLLLLWIDGKMVGLFGMLA